MIKYELSSQVVELAPGQTTDLKLSVTNQSSLIDYFSLSLMPVESAEGAGFDPGWISFAPNTFSLRPGQQTRGMESDSRQDIQILITLPPGVVAGNYMGQIRVDARTGPDNSGLIPLTLVVSELENQVLELQPPEISSRGGTGIYRVSLLNQGNATHLYPIYAEDSADECRFEVIPPEVTLQPGERANLTLRVRPHSRNWAGEERDYDFAVKLEGFPQEVPGRFSQRCALPPVYWMRKHWLTVTALFAALLALLLAAAIFLFPQFTTNAASICGPSSNRNVTLTSNNSVTQIFVSNRGGQFDSPAKPLISEKADVLPGLFANLISVSADGRRLAYVTARNQAMDEAKIWVVDLETRQRQSQPVATIPTGFWPAAPVWSPNGEKLVYVQRAKANNDAAAAAPVVTGTATLATSPVVGNNLPKLDLMIIELDKQPSDPRVLSAGKLVTEQFYGDQPQVVCWNSTNDRVLTLSKSSDTSSRIQSEINLDGSLVTTTPGSVVNRLLASPTAGDKIQPATKAAACALSKPLSENDPRWADQLLKPTDQAGRISDSGCAIVAATMLLNFAGVPLQPDELISRCLPNSASPLLPNGWSDISQRCGSGRVQGMVRAPFNWDNLNNLLNKGPAIVGLLGGQTGIHFVLVTGGTGSIAGNYRVVDPWDGSTYRTLDYYLQGGYKLRWLIAYEGQLGDCTADAPNSATQLNNMLDIKGVRDGALSPTGISFEYELNSGSNLDVKVRSTGPDGNFDTTDVEQPLNTNQTINFNRDGVYTVSTADKTGKIPTQNFYFVIDSSVPTVTNSIISAPDKTGNFIGSVKIQLRATDPLSGIALIEYQLDDSGEWQPYNSDTTSNPLTVDKPGSHTLTYRATDGAGNRADGVPVSFTIEAATTATQTVATPTTTIPGVVASAAPGAATTVRPPAGGGPVAGGVVPPPTVRNVNNPPPAATTPPVVNTTVRVPNTLPPTAVPPTLTPVPSPTAAPSPTLLPSPTATLTPKPAPLLAVSTPQLSYDPNTSSQSFIITNKGSLGKLTWSLATDSSVTSRLNFSSSSGSLDPGANISIKADLTAPYVSSNPAPLVVSFKITSNGGESTMQVIISTQPVPTAIFAPIDTAALDTPSLKVSLQVTDSPRARADHARIEASYTSGTTPVTVVLQPTLKPDAAGNWSFNWDTTVFPATTAITLKGKICADAAETVCTPIAPFVAIFPLTATITNPTTSQVLSSSVPVSATNISQRANHITLVYTASDGVPVTLTQKLTAASNWAAIPWDVSVITPTISSAVNADGSTSALANPVRLEGYVCSSATDDPTLCKKIVPAVTNLNVVMQANVDVSPVLTNTGTTLTGPVNITFSNASTNIDHFSIYAKYRDDTNTLSPVQSFWQSGQSVRRAANQATIPTTAISWDPFGIPPQSSVKLAIYACYKPDETFCFPLKSFSNLTIPNSGPYQITANNTRAVIAVPGTLVNSFAATVKDAYGYPANNQQVTYSISNLSLASFGSANTITTGASGVVASPLINTFGSSNFNPGLTAPTTGFGAFVNTPSRPYAVTASLVSGGDPQRDKIDWMVYNQPATNGDNIFLGSFSPSAVINSSFGTITHSTWHELSGGSYYMNFGFALPSFGATGNFRGGSGNIIYPPSPPFAALSAGFPLFLDSKTWVFYSTGFLYSPTTQMQFVVDSGSVAGSYALMGYSNYITPGRSGTYYPSIMSLTNLPGPPASLTLTAGTISQTVGVNNTAPKRFQVMVKDSSGNTITSLPSGTTVSFQVIPGTSGAGGSFSGSSSFTSTDTGNNSVITAPRFVANNITGNYIVRVTLVSGAINLTKDFNVTNVAVS
jgi:hypothetical protein